MFDGRDAAPSAPPRMLLAYYIRHAFTNVTLSEGILKDIGDNLFAFNPPAPTLFSFISDSLLHSLLQGLMAATRVSSRPGSPESATLVVLQAYDDATVQCSSSPAADNTQPDTANTSPADSPSRSDFRLSAVSCSSTVNLIPPRPSRGSRGEFRESPFRWIHPSLPDLSVHEQEPGFEHATDKGKKPAMRIWEGWKVVLFCSCKMKISFGGFIMIHFWWYRAERLAVTHSSLSESIR